METSGLITKTSYDFSSQDYLELDHKSIANSRLTSTIPCDLSVLSYNYRKVVTESDFGIS